MALITTSEHGIWLRLIKPRSESIRRSRARTGRSLPASPVCRRYTPEGNVCGGLPSSSACWSVPSGSSQRTLTVNPKASSRHSSAARRRQAPWSQVTFELYEGSGRQTVPPYDVRLALQAQHIGAPDKLNVGKRHP